jgi:ABC-type transport system involved in multi-copper enzyme maturation permease subunit
MIRFTLRQFRFPVLVVSGLLGAVAVVLLMTGPHMAQLFGELKNCKPKNDCSYLTTLIATSNSKIDNFMTATSLVLPAIIGIFWGAPLIARELETGTYRLAWSQGVTRSKWIASKLAVVGISSMIAAGLMSWMLTWWSSPIDTVNANRFGSQIYDTHYIVPIGYAAFAFAVGVTAGVLWRRTLPAMATTLVVFVAARITFAQKIRPYLLSPLKQVSRLTRQSGYGFEQTPNGLHFIVSPGNLANTLLFNSVVVGKHGAHVTSQWLQTHCPNIVPPGPSVPGHSSVGLKVKGPAPKAFSECVDKIAANFHQVLTFQPASRFWPFQWIEASLFFAVGVVLCGFTYWWLRRRVN